MLALLVTAVVLLDAVKSPVVDACSMPQGWRPLSTAEKIQRASDVLFARVRETFPDSQRPWMQSIYTAEVDVYCILKGRRTPPVLNITQVGRSFPVTCLEFLLPHDAMLIVQCVLRPDVCPSVRPSYAGIV